MHRLPVRFFLYTYISLHIIRNVHRLQEASADAAAAREAEHRRARPCQRTLFSQQVISGNWQSNLRFPIDDTGTSARCLLCSFVYRERSGCSILYPTTPSQTTLPPLCLYQTWIQLLISYEQIHSSLRGRQTKYRHLKTDMRSIFDCERTCALYIQPANEIPVFILIIMAAHVLGVAVAGNSHYCYLDAVSSRVLESG